MKVFVIICILSFISNIKADILADQWKNGALLAGKLDLEPDLSGEKLYSSILSDVAAYIGDLETNIRSQFGGHTSGYASRAYGLSRDLNIVVSLINSTSPPDFLDGMVMTFTNFLDDFLEDFQSLSSETKALRPQDTLSKLRLVPTQPPPHKMDDILSHIDTIIRNDLSVLSQYIQEVLYLGNSMVSQHYADIMKEYRESPELSSALSMVKGALMNAQRYTDKLQAYTSRTLFLRYDIQLKNAMDLVNKATSLHHN